MNQLLGERVKELRVSRHITQEQVAEFIGMSRQKYARIENGTKDVTLSELTLLSECFHVTVADITKILDKTKPVDYREGIRKDTAKGIFEMLDLLYANKHMYQKLQRD